MVSMVADVSSIACVEVKNVALSTGARKKPSFLPKQTVGCDAGEWVRKEVVDGDKKKIVLVPVGKTDA